MKKIILFLFLIIFLTSCFWQWQDTKWWGEVTKKDLNYYKQVWKDTFNFYQTNTSEIKNFWLYAFDFSIMVSWTWTNLTNFWNIHFKDPFSSYILQLDGNYDFRDKQKLVFDGNIKMYLNNVASWIWDIDINIVLVDNKKMKYTVNNIDKKVLSFFLTNEEQINALFFH
jgi:hypothetical protein